VAGPTREQTKKLCENSAKLEQPPKKLAEGGTRNQEESDKISMKEPKSFKVRGIKKHKKVQETGGDANATKQGRGPVGGMGKKS